jgi:hypothetical protein
MFEEQYNGYHFSPSVDYLKKGLDRNEILLLKYKKDLAFLLSRRMAQNSVALILLKPASNISI